MDAANALKRGWKDAEAGQRPGGHYIRQLSLPAIASSDVLDGDIPESSPAGKTLPSITAALAGRGEEEEPGKSFRDATILGPLSQGAGLHHGPASTKRPRGAYETESGAYEVSKHDKICKKKVRRSVATIVIHTIQLMPLNFLLPFVNLDLPSAGSSSRSSRWQANIRD